MMTGELIEIIRGLLARENSSQRAIARRLGVSRGVVQAVARGRPRLRAPRERVTGNGFRPPAGMFLRCPGCGGKVQMPCLACYLRRQDE